MKKKLISMVLTLSMAAAMLAGCGSSADNKESASKTDATVEKESGEEAKDDKTVQKDDEIVQIQWTWVGHDWELDPEWPYGPYADWNEAVGEKLGCEVVLKGYTAEQFDLLLASGEFIGDIVYVDNNYQDRMIEMGQMVDFYDYEELVPNMLSFNEGKTAEALSKHRSAGTGGLYWWSPACGLPGEIIKEKQLWAGLTIRWDLYKELGYPEVKNEDDFLNVVKQIVDKHPTTENGDKVYGVATYGNDLWGWYIGGYRFGQETFNATNYFDTQTGEYYNAVADGESMLWSQIEYYFKANQLGIFDPDSFTMNGDELNAKATNGQIVSPMCEWYGGNYYNNALAEDPESVAGYMVLPVEGLNYPLAGNSVLGWYDKMHGVNAESEHVELAVKVCDFMHTEESIQLLFRGKEGRNWEYVDGVPTVTEEAKEIYLGSDGEAKKHVNGMANQFVPQNESVIMSDGLPGKLWLTSENIQMTLNPLQKEFSEYYGVDYPGMVFEKLIAEGKATDRANMGDWRGGIGVIPDDILRIDANLGEYMMSMIPDLIMAEDRAAFDKLKEDVIAKAFEMGAQDSIDWWEAEVEAAKAKFE